jgi:hypothetical protein
MKSFVSIARFATLANRHVTMRRGDSITIQGDAHPESGVYCEVVLKYDGDGYLLDGEPLMLPSQPARNGWKSGSFFESRVSAGSLSWEDSAKAAMALLGAKESQAARGFCVAQDEAFLRLVGMGGR